MAIKKEQKKQNKQSKAKNKPTVTKTVKAIKPTKQIDKPKKEQFPERQKRFCDNYIKYGEISRSAVEAGYSKSYADTTASRILELPRCKEYMAKRLAKHEAKTIAEQEEVLSFLSGAMRGEVKDQFELDAQLRDRIEAAKQLQKRYDIIAKMQTNVNEKEFDGIPARLIAPSFLCLYHEIISSEKYNEFLVKGGRGSTKSSFIGLVIIELIEKYPNMHALAMRKIGNTMRDSIYSQIAWAINELDLNDEYDLKVSPLEITKISTGQKIYFRGADKPEKIKSIKPQFGYIGILWFEECDQFNGEDAVRNIEQSAKRGGDKTFTFKSYNPPQTTLAWVNKYSIKPKENLYVHESDYLTVPKHWLGSDWLSEAEILKELNPKKYEHEYLGVANGTGINVFDNVTLRAMTDDEVKKFDRIYNGLDWGWFPDPFHFGRMHYDAARKTLYIFFEYRCNKQSNQQTATTLKEFGLTYQDLITCDSAEMKSIDDYKSYDLYAKPTFKFPGSVEYSMKWLQSLNEIVIDNGRCPNTADEFSTYEYEVDKDGNVITSFPDCNNHSIDMVRYAMTPVWNRRGE